jgi:putative DNA primase/helicase
MAATPTRGATLAVVPPAAPPPGKTAVGVGVYHRTDVGNADQLVATKGRDLRYCHPWARWLVWTGQRWETDETGEAQLRMKETLRDMMSSAVQLADDEERGKLIKHVLASEQAPRIRGALQLAQSDPRIAVRPSELDVDPTLFNVQNGTIQLDAAAIYDHRREDLVTKLAPVEFDAAATAPRWDAFLERVQPDPEVRAYLRRAVGYSLAAETSEQVLLICHGSGANGKTTFFEALRAMLGDYGQQAPAETFLEHGDRIPNDVARLRGARFVAASEVAEGRRLNEALVKRMTGGDTMTARFMRAEFFEFKPTFTPWLATNHRPEIRGTDEAIWRRIHLIPFEVTIPPKERDPDLPMRLRRELAGILNWALAGYAEWRANGLDPPEAVLAATTEYRHDSDVLGGFLEDCCELADGATVTKAELHTRFGYWATQNGAEPLTAKALGARLIDRGFKEGRTSTGRYWVGIRIRRDEEVTP